MERLLEAVREAATDGRLPCAHAAALAHRFSVSIATVGRVANEAELRIVRCQLGLFGFDEFETKSLIPRLPSVAPWLVAEIRTRLDADGLPCEAAWPLADAAGLPRIALSAAADALGVRIVRCQLGCF